MDALRTKRLSVAIQEVSEQNQTASRVRDKGPSLQELSFDEAEEGGDYCLNFVATSFSPSDFRDRRNTTVQWDRD